MSIVGTLSLSPYAFCVFSMTCLCNHGSPYLGRPVGEVLLTPVSDTDDKVMVFALEPDTIMG